MTDIISDMRLDRYEIFKIETFLIVKKRSKTHCGTCLSIFSLWILTPVFSFLATTFPLVSGDVGLCRLYDLTFLTASALLYDVDFPGKILVFK